MPEIGDLPPLREIIRLHGLRAEKSLGQNFLLDLNLTSRIARLCENLSARPDELTVFEIGPGPGGLTRSLLATPVKKIVALEFDARAVAALDSLKEAAAGKLDIFQTDALDADLTAMAPGPRAIVANLPYNISTVLLVKWLRQIRGDAQAYDFMVLMFQKEVAERLMAPPGGKTYGRLSVLSQWLCEIRKGFDLAPSAFTPAPKVTSTVLVFQPREASEGWPAFAAVEEVLARAFQQRRKMLRSSLKGYEDRMAVLGIDPSLRAENLSVGDYLRLAGGLA